MRKGWLDIFRNYGPYDPYEQIDRAAAQRHAVSRPSLLTRLWAWVKRPVGPMGP